MSQESKTISASWITNILLAIAGYFMVQALENQQENTYQLIEVRQEVIELKVMLLESIKDYERLELELKKYREQEKNPPLNKEDRPPIVAHFRDKGKNKKDEREPATAGGC